MDNKEKEFLNNPDYDIVYEKLFMPELFTDDFNYTLNKAFAISNEHLPKVFEGMNLKNKRVLTVGSSGDQLLNAILCGSSDITVIDANIFTRPFIEYKLAVIKTFDYENFDDLFIKPRMFNWKVYAKISHLLSPLVKQFWDSLMLDVQPNGQWYEFREENITSSMLIIDHKDRHSSFYKDEIVYNKLKSLLNQKDLQMQFITAEFKEFPKVLKHKFDFIYLSNIYDYYKQEKNKPVFISVVDNLYKHNLKSNGKMVVNYDFEVDAKTAPIKLDKHKLSHIEVKRWTYGKIINDTVWVINKTTPQKSDNDICR